MTVNNHETDGAGPSAQRAIDVGRGRTAVHLELQWQGEDLLVVISGGRAHVGAVAVCDGRRDRSHVRTGEWTLELPGHREGPLAAEAAETIATALQRTCAAVVGIHQDDATADEIHSIVSHVRQGLQLLVAPEQSHDT